MSSVGTWTSWEGSVVEGRFPLQRWLGGSDHSAVFLTEWHSQKAAIKLIPALGADAEHYLARWRAAAQLSHPHLLRIYDSGRCTIDGTRPVYVVMEYAEEDLAQIFPQRVLTPGEVSDLLPPLLDALFYLRGKGFVHSRIKPSNILAVKDELKLSADQILSASDTNSTRRRDVYDAPETAAGIFSPAGDVWSVGVTLVAMLTQNESFAEEDSQRDPDLPGSIPEPFRGIARECLHLDPRRRCSLAEIKARLQPPGRSVPAAEPVPAQSPRSNRGAVTFFVLLVALVVALAVFYSRGKKASAPPARAAEQPVTQAAPPTRQPTRQPVRQTVHQTVQPAAKAAQPPPASAPSSSKTTPLGGAVKHEVIPDVSRGARNTITGHVRVNVRVEVDSSGKVTAAKLASPGPSKYFANLAWKAAQGWEFSPAEVGGQPAASVWMLHFRFGRGGTDVSSERVAR